MPWWHAATHCRTAFRSCRRSSITFVQGSRIGCHSLVHSVLAAHINTSNLSGMVRNIPLDGQYSKKKQNTWDKGSHPAPTKPTKTKCSPIFLWNGPCTIVTLIIHGACSLLPYRWRGHRSNDVYWVRHPKSCGLMPNYLLQATKHSLFFKATDTCHCNQYLSKIQPYSVLTTR